MVFKHPALNGRIIDSQEAEMKRLRAALQAILAIENRTDGGDWDEIEDARLIARDALCNQKE